MPTTARPAPSKSSASCSGIDKRFGLRARFGEELAQYRASFLASTGSGRLPRSFGITRELSRDRNALWPSMSASGLSFFRHRTCSASST